MYFYPIKLIVTKFVLRVINFNHKYYITKKQKFPQSEPSEIFFC